MAATLRIKRRTSVGSAGAPTTLASGEPAYNEADNILYYGSGDDGSGNATSVIQIAGTGAYVDRGSSQSIAGTKTFTSSPVAPTPTAGDSSTKVATTAFVAAAVTAAGGSAVASIEADLTFQGVGGLAPPDTYEFDDHALLFSQGAAQAVTLQFRLPTRYVSGAQISLRLGFYTPGTTGNFKFQVVTYLVRKNTDAITSTTNANTTSNADQAVGATANVYYENTFLLTDATGKINAVSVSAGDILRCIISRVTATGTEDTNDVRMIVGSAEVKLA